MEYNHYIAIFAEKNSVVYLNYLRRKAYFMLVCKKTTYQQAIQLFLITLNQTNNYRSIILNTEDQMF
jgi:hypothetical protein